MEKGVLLVETKAPVGAVVELAGLCVDGWVFENRIDGAVLQYSVHPSSQRQIEFNFEFASFDHSEWTTELLLLMFGMISIGATISTSGSWSQPSLISSALEWSAQLRRPGLSLSKPIHLLSHLNLRSLEEIYKLLSSRQIPVSDLMREPDFIRSFPFIDKYAGSYGPLRHESGTTVMVDWIDNQFPGRHKLEAPTPSSQLYWKWMGKPSRGTIRNTSTPGPYRDSEMNRWKVAYLLGSIPAEHKARVFSWVVDCFNSVDYFHDSRGQVVLPEIFSIEFEQRRMTATHDFVFRLE